MNVVTRLDCAAAVTAVRSTFSHNWIMKWDCLFTCPGQEEPAAFTTDSCQSSVIRKKALIWVIKGRINPIDGGIPSY